MQAHAQLMNTESMGLPVLYCLGNHDCVAGDYGEQAFEELFGPCRYSFNAGGIHFLVVPMTEGWDVRPSYTEDELAALCDFCRDNLAHVNIIKLNDVKGSRFQPSSDARAGEFVRRLASVGVEATIRNSRGPDIDAACGQLRQNVERNLKE